MKPWREVVIERLKNDPIEADHYVKAALDAYDDDQDTVALLTALKTMVDVHGGMG